MKKLIVLAVASLVATSADAAEMKWSGSAGWRYEQTKQDDNLNSRNAAGRDTSKLTTKSHAIRANLGATGGWENVEWGVGVRTNNTANNDHVFMGNNADIGLGFEQAWFRYLRDFGSVDMSATIGRQRNVLAYDAVSQNLFDNDVRWDGFGWQFKFGMFGLNAAQYITGAKSQGVNGTSTQTKTAASEATANQNSKFNYLLAFQPHMTWRFTDEIETMFAVGYYLWSDDSNTNLANGGSTASWNAGSVAPAAGTGSAVNIHNPKQWHFLSTWTLPYSLNLNLEYVMNKETKLAGNAAGYAPANPATNPEISKSAWSAGLTYGALRRAQDFTLGYAYGSKGLGAVINRYTYEKFAADNKGHTFNVGYALADNFHLGWKGIFLKEKEKISPRTGLANTGATANQELKTTYWELTAGVMF